MVEIIINGQLVADVPDKTGEYLTINGERLYINVDEIDPQAKIQRIVLENVRLKGKSHRPTANASGNRILELSNDGTGFQLLPKGGDLTVRLGHRPIYEVTHAENKLTLNCGDGIREITHQVSYVSWVNPYWKKDR